MFENSATGFYAPAQLPWFNVVVEKSEKPKGILQDKPEMRTAVMGYLNEKSGDNSAGDGGVLRAKMVRVMDKEVNADGSFKVNPYPADASASGVANSGVINYVNKFGDDTQYDNKDPVSELYYTAIRYLRNGAWKWESDGTQTRSGTAGALPYTLPASPTEVHKGGFPVITTWDDPLKAEGDKDKDMQCYTPGIIVLGDTNTHNEKNLPNYPTASGITDNVALDKDGTTKYYEKVCRLSGFCPDTDGTNDWRVSSGSKGYDDKDYAPTFGMAGMAYWVKTNDVRPDIVREDGQPTHIDSFFIDVLEGGHPKTKGNLYSATTAKSDDKMQNSYYLAGKFASPDYEVGGTYTRTDFDSTNDKTRSLWTDDKWDPAAKNSGSSNEFFPLGMPKNFAVANDPQNMKNALEAAFRKIGITKNTMQSGVQYNIGYGAELILSAKGSANLVAQGYIEAIKELKDGKEVITGYKVKDHAAVQAVLDEYPALVPLTFRAGYNTTNWTG
ncbi:MAG: hypothetical protein J6W29_09655, partial [Neisseriaceae bacterium]|nr:hypothetical protein [Neisseriaceae bacterium]